MSEGILGGLSKYLQPYGITAKPNIENNEIRIEVTAEQMKNAITQGMNETLKNSINVELHEGKLIIKVKLF